MNIQCFWTEPTGRARVSLRRYVSARVEDRPCPKTGYHNAETPIGEVEAYLAASFDDDDTYKYWHYKDDPNPPHDDPRWPTHCACGYAFAESDQWQVFHDTLYHRPDTGEIFGRRELPVGAFFDVGSWHGAFRAPHAPNDGIDLALITPGGKWRIDGPASNGDGWRRTGDPKANPPTVSADPSILAHPYHGWLRNGVLVDA